jgi:TonB family protein
MRLTAMFRQESEQISFVFLKIHGTGLNPSTIQGERLRMRVSPKTRGRADCGNLVKCDGDFAKVYYVGASENAVKPIARCIVTLVYAGLLQGVPSPGQTVGPPAQAPLKIDVVTGVRNLVNKPELTYPKEAREQHIEGKVELELTVSPQGDVVSERVISGQSALQQATTDAFKRAKYIPFLRNLEPSVALVRVIVVYEKDHAMISTEREHGPEKPNIRNLAKPGGDFGLGTGAPGHKMGNLEILSDTQGVDFGPYLQGVLHDVKQNWYNAIPESVQGKHGNVIIEFAITKGGRLAGMKLVAPSGDVPLDRAAWAGIVGSAPFPPLPSEFGGQYIALRFAFSYNPTKEELGPVDSTASAPAVK